MFDTEKPDYNTQESSDSQEQTTDNESGQAQAIADCKAQVRVLQEQLATLQDRYARLFADIENMKRRAAEEQKLKSELLEKKIFLDLLPVIDNFERALAVISQRQEKDNSGMDLIYSLLQKFLKQHGIKEIETTGEFDPELHEAISQVTDDKKKSGSIVHVFEKGYYLRDKILRHAKVSVVS